MVFIIFVFSSSIPLSIPGVRACLQAGGRPTEAEHEVGEGPQRSRLNRDNLVSE